MPDSKQDPLVKAVQGVIERRSKILAEEIIQDFLDAFRSLSEDKMAAVINGTERVGMKGYKTSTMRKKKS